MDDLQAQEINNQLKIISRSLAFLCLTMTPIANRPLGIQARVLKTMGYNNAEIADILNSTPNSIAVRLSETKSWRADIDKTTNEG